MLILTFTGGESVMGNFQSKLKSVLITLCLVGFSGLAFQNCSGSKFATVPPIVDAVCDVGSGCVSAASTGDEESEDSDDNTNPIVTPVNVPATTNNSDLNSTDPRNLYNFVAGDKKDCENSIQERLGKSIACTVGGGCGVSCGFPSSSCPSANPTYYGACVTASGNGADGMPAAAPAPTVDPRTLYNFVAGDKASCEGSIQSTFNRPGTCSVGGGCGISCGVPGGSCVSANPSYWGACLSR